MKKIILFLIIIFGSTILSQPIRIGGDINFGLISVDQKTIFGAELCTQYLITGNFAIEVDGAFNYSNYENIEGKPSPSYSIVTTSINLSFLYYPLDGLTSPYFGGGIGYFDNRSDQDGNSMFTETYSLTAPDIQNAIGFNLQTGIIIGSRINFGIEYRIQFPERKLIAYYYNTDSTGILSDRINLSTLICKFGMMFNL